VGNIIVGRLDSTEAAATYTGFEDSQLSLQ